MALKVIAPEQFTGQRSGLEFVDGVAEVDSLDDAARAVLADHGFTVEATQAEVEAAEAAAAEADAEAARLAEQQSAAEAEKQTKK